jgi:hypothetical protein
MKGTLIVVTALAGLALATPALAQDVYVGTNRHGGIGVGVDVDRGYDRSRREREVYTSGYDRSRRCETTITRRSDGSVRKVRRCED